MLENSLSLTYDRNTFMLLILQASKCPVEMGKISTEESISLLNESDGQCQNCKILRAGITRDNLVICHTVTHITCKFCSGHTVPLSFNYIVQPGTSMHYFTWSQVQWDASLTDK